MVAFYLVLFAIIFWGVHWKRVGFFDDNLGKNQCTAIKGIFIWIVFARHIGDYIPHADGALNIGYNIINVLVGQLLVVMFLFYSGYGVMQQIKRKGASYVKGMPRNRIVNTFVNFDIAVVSFVVLNLISGVDMQLRQILLSLVCWDSVGNSNWYIFAILACYTLTWCVCVLAILHGKNANAAFAEWWIWALVVLLSLSLSTVKQSWWYNTIFAFPLGITYSIHEDRIKGYVSRHYSKILGFSIVALCVMFAMPYEWRGVSNNLFSMSFAFLVVMLTMKVKIGNPILIWLGAHLFPLYIYQRLPMIGFRQWLGKEFIATHPIPYSMACVTVTLLIAATYHHWEVNIKSK